MARPDGKGVSTFFYFAIPAVLALAALWWLAFGQGLHFFVRQISQEQRAATAVGADPLPKESMKITISDPRDAAVRVEKVEIDGGDLWVYYKNFGATRASYIKLLWRLVGPDGTVLKSREGYVDIYSRNSAAGSLEPGERGEAQFKIPSDPRSVRLDVRMVQ
jgi:hypothetical protein